MESSPLKLTVSSKRLKLSVNFESCVLCQSETDEPLRKASIKGINTLLIALKRRRDAGATEVFDSLKEWLDENEFGKLILKDSTPQIVWHKNCYSTFTSITNLAAIDGGTTATTSSLHDHVAREQFSWKALCMFCGQKSYKKDKVLIPVRTFNCCRTLEQCCNNNNDENLRRRVGDFSKLIALEARYHKACHSLYTLKPKVHKSAENVHNVAFEQLIESLKPELDNGHALDMNQLLHRFHEILKQYMPESEAKAYTKHKLKSKLETHCSDFLTIHHLSSIKPDVVLSKSLALKDIINMIADQKQMLKSIMGEEEVSTNVGGDLSSPALILFHAALILRTMLKSVTGLEHQFITPEDVSLKSCENSVPDELYTFLSWIISAAPPESLHTLDKDDMRDTKPSLHRHILALAQDMIYMRSKGHCKMPKHTGLGVALHQMTQSAEIVRLINKHGHGISYDEVQRIDTCWAKSQMSADGSMVPANMVPGQITRGAGDNFNRATESLQGKHHDVVNMVLYQTATEERRAMSVILPRPEETRARTLEKATYDIHQIQQCPNLGGRQPGPQHLFGRINLDWYHSCSQEHMQLRSLDRELILLRMMPLKIFEAQMDALPKQIVPGWTVFHAIVTPREML